MELPANDRGEKMSEQQPTALGRYQILEELGRGAMGAVYKAFDPVIARTVALKTILIDNRAPDRAQMIERLKQEAKAAGGLDHPNIITIYDVGEENGAVYLSMQYVQGTTLATLLADAGVPPLPTLLSWAGQISAAVGFAHARGVIHRDLKPANLMVTDQGTIKVLDFGIAKIENTSLTQTGLVVGTPAYMSPEQIAGKKVDHRSDIFSLGAVFYELMTREKAFAGDIATILYKIVNEHPVAPSIVNPAVPGGIDAVVRKALAKDPKDRFQTCEEMRQAFVEQSVGGALTSAANRAPASVRRDPQARAPQTQPASSQLWSHLILSAAVLLVAAAGWAFYVRSTTGDFPPLVTKLENKIQALRAGNGEASNSATPAAGLSIARPTDAGPAVVTPPDDHSAAAPTSQAPETAGAPATAKPTPAIAAVSNPADTATLQPVAAQSISDQSKSDQPASGDHSAMGSPAPSPMAEKPQKSVAPSDNVLPKDVELTANDRTAAGNATAHSPFAARPTSGDDETQTGASSTSKARARKRGSESPASVDGFSRDDVPDLLRQANTYADRGNYRLARYNYGLVLKLDRNNAQAREGLRRVLTELGSR